MSIWNNIDKIEIGGSRDRFEAGEHLVEVLGVEMKQSKNPSRPGAVDAICTFKVLTSETHKAGEPRSCSFAVQPDPYNYGKADVKALVAAALGLDPKAVDPRVMENATGPAQSLKGRQVLVRAVESKKKDGSPFIKVTFAPTGAPASMAPSAPSAPPPALEEKPFPPAGWAANPKAPGYYYRYVNGKAEQLTEAQLRAL